MTPKVLFEDNHLLVVVKPVGMPSQADASNAFDLLTWAKGYLKEKHNKPGNVFVGLVHRLDRMVGGVMVLAKTSKGASRLSQQVRERTIQKTYLAVVHGVPKPATATLRNFLLKDMATNIVRVVGAQTRGAQEAILDYEVLATKTFNRPDHPVGQGHASSEVSLVKIRLHTGRPHQIRVQFAYAWNPLVGDHKYGKPDGVESVTLWSHELRFMHPTKQTECFFTAMPPEIGVWKSFDTKKLTLGEESQL